MVNDNAANSAIANDNNFTIHNIYLKDLSFEAPNTPQIFSVQWEPKVDFDLSMNSQTVAENVWEAVLDVTVKVNIGIAADKRAEYGGKESLTAFIVEVKLAGIFTISGFEQEIADKLLAIEAPAMLFPYLRETVASLVAKGGFPQLILPPMNFETMYKKHLAENNSQSPVAVN